MAEIPIYAARRSAAGRRQKLGVIADGKLILRDRRHGETFEVVLTEAELLARIDESRVGRGTIPGEF